MALKSNAKLPNVEKFKKPASQVIAQQEVGAAPAPESNVQETDEARQARVDRAGGAIRQVLQAESCVLTVPTLDISTGRVFARIEIFAGPLAAPAAKADA